MLSGASMVGRAGCRHGKMVIYPIRQAAGADGLQLITGGRNRDSDLSQARLDPARLDRDFIGAFADWHFDWLDVPAFIRAADHVLEFPMVDQDPLRAGVSAG